VAMGLFAEWGIRPSKIQMKLGNSFFVDRMPFHNARLIAHYQCIGICTRPNALPSFIASSSFYTFNYTRFRPIIRVT
jgi:hypothetical protein